MLIPISNATYPLMLPYPYPDVVLGDVVRGDVVRGDVVRGEVVPLDLWHPMIFMVPHVGHSLPYPHRGIMQGTTSGSMSRVVSALHGVP